MWQARSGRHVDGLSLSCTFPCFQKDWQVPKQRPSYHLNQVRANPRQIRNTAYL